jgi:DNA-binding NarL/FixJ family response regulator
MSQPIRRVLAQVLRFKGVPVKRTRVVIADDHKLLVDALRNLLEPEYEVVGTFSEGDTLVANAPALEPDIVVLDVSMPVMNGLTACAHLKKALRKVKIIFMTMDQDLETAGEAFRSGAAAYVLKTSAATELVTAIREVLRGGYYASPKLIEGMTGSFVQNLKGMTQTHKLTLRQKEVLQLLAEGYSMKQVASVLNITPRTVAFHKYSMMRQLEVNSNAELISYATKASHLVVSAT